MMTQTLQEIEEQLDRLRLEKSRIQAENFKQRVLPELSAAIGTTFVYRNDSSGGVREMETFCKLLTVELSEQRAWLIFEECDIRTNGRAKLELTPELMQQSERAFPILRRGWRSCSSSEYEAQGASVLDQQFIGTPHSHRPESAINWRIQSNSWNIAGSDELQSSRREAAIEDKLQRLLEGRGRSRMKPGKS
jgi:hypothetical protein